MTSTTTKPTTRKEAEDRLERLTEAYNKADKAYRAVENERGMKISDEILKVREAVFEEFRPRMEHAGKLWGEAERAVQEFRVDNTDLLGPLRVGDVIRKVGWGSRPKVEYAVVEVCTKKTRFSATLGTWSKPEIGAQIARYLKKDGTPGLRTETLNDHKVESDWKVVGKDEHNPYKPENK